MRKVSISWVPITGCLVLVLTTSCAFKPEYGLLYTNVRNPAQLDPTKQEVLLQNKEYEVLGRAYGETSITNFLGLVATGDAGIASAYRKALSTYPEADMLIDVRVDTRKTNAFMGMKKTTIVEGTAIKFKR